MCTRVDGLHGLANTTPMSLAAYRFFAFNNFAIFNNRFATFYAFIRYTYRFSLYIYTRSVGWVNKACNFFQLKIYFDISVLQLLVKVVSATGLSPRSDGSPRCPYCKIFLLPDKSEKSKRRTKTLANTCEPRWNQTFVYCGVRITDMKKRTLEVTKELT